MKIFFSLHWRGFVAEHYVAISGYGLHHSKRVFWNHEERKRFAKDIRLRFEVTCRLSGPNAHALGWTISELDYALVRNERGTNIFYRCFAKNNEEQPV